MMMRLWIPLIAAVVLIFGASSAMAQLQCGDPDAGDCCEANGTPYCDDEECCECICACDPFCCDSSWDSLCAGDGIGGCGASNPDGKCTAECSQCLEEPGCGDPETGDCCEAQTGSPYCDDEECCELICAADPFCCNVNWDGICANAANDQCEVCLLPILELTADQACYTGGVGDVVTITIDLAGDGSNAIVGGQFFLTYDTDALAFQSADPGSTVDPNSPFTTQIHQLHVNGTLQYAVGIDPAKDEGTTGDATMAVLTFEVVGDNLCDVAQAVEFDLAAPFENMLANDVGEPVDPTLFDLDIITIDSEPPTFDTFPEDIEVPADAGTCEAVLSITPPTASDNCDDDPVVTFVRSDDPNLTLEDPFPQGTTIVTWTATDACGNSTSEEQTVTVLGENVLVVDLALQPAVASTLTRCITFEFLDPATGEVIETVQEDVTFTDGTAAVTMAVPCGLYDACFLARDELHTLRSTGHLEIVGTEYEAGLDEALVGGDLNDDGVVDIIDFSIFVWQFGTTDPDATGDSPCGTGFPHADITGDGEVGSGDFAFIQVNFLAMDALCPESLLAGPEPRTRISVDELRRMGLGHLAIADLTGDGWVGPEDVAAFAAGERPDPR